MEPGFLSNHNSGTKNSLSTEDKDYKSIWHIRNATDMMNSVFINF